MSRVISIISSAITRLIVSFGLTLMIANGAARAQNPYDTGTPVEARGGASWFSAYAPDKLENVNLANGNFMVNIPLATLGGRGSASYTFTLSHHSKLWTSQHNPEVITDPFGISTIIHHFQPNYGDGVEILPNSIILGGGWFIMKAPAIKIKTFGIDARRSPPYPGWYYYVLTKLWLVLPDGSEIELRDEATQGAPAPGPAPDPVNNPLTDRNRGRVWKSVDGSAITYVNDTNVGGLNFVLSGWVLMPDGTRFRIDFGRCNKFIDRNGNYINIAYDTPTTGAVTYTDQLGRQVVLQGGASGATVTVKGYNGLADRVYTVETDRIGALDGSGNPINMRSDYWSVQRPIIAGDYLQTYYGPIEHTYTGPHTDLFYHGEHGIVIDDVVTPTKLIMPDGRFFTFRYDIYALLAEIAYPGGGKTQIDYTGGPSDVCEVLNSPFAADVNRRVTQRRVLSNGSDVDAVWIYNIGAESGPTSSFEVRQGGSAGPLLMAETHYFLALNAEYRRCYQFGGDFLDYGSDGTMNTKWENAKVYKVERQTGSGLLTETRNWAQRAPVVWAPDPGSGTNGYAARYGQEQPSNDDRVTREDSILENGKLKRVEYDYDNFNNVTLMREYDYGTNPNPGPLIRETARSYATSLNGSCYSNLNPSDPGCGSGIAADINSIIHLRSLTLQESVWDKTTNEEQARATYEYDVYADDGNRATLVDYASVTGHDAAWSASRAARGNVTQVGRWLKESNTYLYTYSRYDEVGNPVATKDPRGNVSGVSFADDFGNGDNPGGGAVGNFGPTYAFPTLFTSPPPNPGAAPHTARAQYDFSRGTQTGFKDRNNIIAKTEYNDPFNRPTKVIAAKGVAGVEAHTSFYYAPSNVYGVTLNSNDVMVVKDRDLADDAILRSWTLTDGFGRTIEDWTRHPQGDVKVTTVYDGLGRAIQTSNPYRNGEAPVYTTTTYDLAGRVTTVLTPDGAHVDTAYTGNQVTVTDQAVKRRRSETDALGRLIKVTEDPGNLNYETYYSYDALGNLRQVTQGSQTRNFVYDSLSRLNSATNPESGTVTYAYDPNGNLVEKTDARGVKTTMAYDALNRVRSKVYAGTTQEGTEAANLTPPVNYFYDDYSVLPSGAPRWSGTPSKGRLIGVTYGGGSEGTYYKYNVAGRILTNHQRQGIKDYVTTYTCNLAGGILREWRGNFFRNSWTYDNAGRISSMDASFTPFLSFINLVKDISYTPFGGLQSETYGNSLIHSMAYNSRHQPTEIRLGRPDNLESVFRLGYIYGTANNVNGQDAEITLAHNNGNVARIKYLISGTVQYTQTFQYDPLNRLSYAVEHNNGEYNDAARAWYQTFGYDRYGNRGINVENTSDNVDAANTALKPADFSGANNRITRDGYLYDAAGNLIVEPGKSYTYDAENRIVRAEVAGGATSQYVYDGNGRRVKKIIGGVATRFEYGAGGELIAERNESTGAVTKWYFYNGGQLLATTTTGTTYEYATSDHLGSPRAWTDNSGNLVAGGRHDYAPFGEELSAGIGIRSANLGYGDDSARQKFGSKERDNETGLDYFGARYFSSIQGRFTSPDWSPLLVPVPYADLNDPQTINRYSYVRNNPLWRMDKDGHDWDWWKKLKNWATNGGWTADDQEAAKTRRERQVKTARFFANEWAKEHPNAKFDQSKYSDDQIVKAFQNGAFSKTANDPFDPLQIFGMVVVYRGGPTLKMRDIDVKIDKQTGLVQPGKGVSLSSDPASLERFGGAYEVDITSVPPELEVIQRGQNPHHYELPPRQAMTPEHYQELLDKVKLTPVKPPSQ